MRKLVLVLTLAILAPNLAYANPVSFKDGWGVMPSSGKGWRDLQVNYSVTNKYAFGLSEYYRKGRDSKADFGIGQFNYLIERWNEMESQANIYASVGIGGRHDSVHDDGFAGYGALGADYETRRIYTLLAGESLQSANGVDFNRIRYRAGIAPYKAGFESLQTWLFLQVEYTPEMDDKVKTTPLVRLFYNNYALEVGVSLDGDPFLGAMAHF